MCRLLSLFPLSEGVRGDLPKLTVSYTFTRSARHFRRTSLRRLDLGQDTCVFGPPESKSSSLGIWSLRVSSTCPSRARPWRRALGRPGPVLSALHWADLVPCPTGVRVVQWQYWSRSHSFPLAELGGNMSSSPSHPMYLSRGRLGNFWDDDGQFIVVVASVTRGAES